MGRPFLAPLLALLCVLLAITMAKGSMMSAISEKIMEEGKRAVSAPGLGLIKTAKMTITCDNQLAGVYVNGKKVHGLPNAGDWTKSKTVNVPHGTRTVAIECIDQGVIAGILASSNTGMVTDGTWKCSSSYHANWYGVTYDDSKWHKATVIAGNGAKPWGKRPGISSKAKWIWTSGFKGSHMRVFCRRSFGKRPAPAFPTLRYSTPKVYKYKDTGLVLSGKSAFVFSVKACNDAHLALTNTRNKYTANNMYEIVIGGWSNTKSVIRRSKQGKNLATHVHGANRPLSCKSPRRFWVSWSGGKVRVGNGFIIGQNEFMSYRDPKPIKVSSVAISTWGDAAGSWQFPTRFSYSGTTSTNSAYKKTIKGVLFVGHNPIARSSIDSSKTGTFIDRRRIQKAGVVYGVRFYANVAGRPLTLGIYRPTKKAGQFKAIHLLSVPGNKVRKGLNTVSLFKKRIKVQKGDSFGFTWNKFGVIGFTKTKTRGHYYDRDIVPRKGQTISFTSKNSARNYAFTGIYVPYKVSSSRPIKLPATEKVCSSKADIVFALDGSGSVGARNFRVVQAFTKHLINHFKVSRTNVRVGAVLYSSGSKTLFGLKNYKSNADVNKAIDKIRYRGGWTRTDMAIRDAYKIVKREGRQNTPNMIVVITDGNSTKPIETRKWSKYVQKRNVQMFSLGIGRGIGISELKTIASDPDRSHMFMVKDFASLKNVISPLAGAACKAAQAATKLPSQVPVKTAKLTLTCDNRLAGVYVNGKKVRGLPNAGDWTKSKTVNVPRGTRTVAIECIDKGVIAGILASSNTGIVTDGTWKCSSTYRAKWYGMTYDDSKWHKATVIARNGAKPWGKRPGISSKAKWIWTSGFKGRHMRVFCRRSFGKRPAPQRTPIIPKNVVRVGYSPVKRTSTDGAKVWTFIQRRSFSRPGRLYGVQFNANKAGRPLQVGVFRPTGRSGEFKTVYKYPISGRRIKVGTNTFNLYPRNIRVRKGDKIGFTWNKYGVVGYQPTKSRGTYYERNIVPSTGKKYKYSTKYGNRLYALRALYVPSKQVQRTPIIPKNVVRVGYSPVKRSITDTAKVWTFIQRRSFARPGRLYGVQFNANKAGRPLQVGVFRPTGRSGEFKTVYKYPISGRRIKVGTNTFNLYPRNIRVRKGDKIGFTWNKYGVVGFQPTKSRGTYYERNIVPSTGKKYKYSTKYGNRLYALRALYVPTKRGKTAKLTLTCDNRLAGVYVNGKKVRGLPNAGDWTKSKTVNVPRGTRTVAIECIDKGVIAGILASSNTGMVTDGTWKCSSTYRAKWYGVTYDDSKWHKATVIARNGAKPWGKRPGISSKAKWIWTSGFKGRHMRVFCRRSFGKRPAPQRTPIIPKNVVRVGYSPVKRSITDTAKTWTFIQRRSFSRPGRLYGVQFNANKAGRPLQVGVFRPTGRSGEFKTVYKYPISGRRIKVGTNTFNLYPRNIRVRKGDKIGFTWNKYGVVGFQPTKSRGTYYERNIVPSTGKKYKYSTKYGNRLYALRALYVPTKRVKTAKLTLTCDNRLAGVYVNGKKVRGLPNAGDWTKSKTVNVPRGTRTVAIECIDKGVIAGILASSNTGMVTDGTWKCSSTYRAKWYGVTYDDSKWHKATVIARNGAKPWGKRPGISSKAKWIWTSGFKGRHMRVFCRRSFGKRPAPQRTPIIPKNVVRVGYSPVKRTSTDGAKVWTFIQRRSFSRPGRLYGVQFNANKAGRPLQVGVFRPTGRSGEFKTVYKYPISGRRIKVGTNTFNLYPRNIRVRKGDTIGFTWNKYGVVGYQPTKSRGTYYERNIVPSTGKKYKYSTKYGNRLYALRALYVPSKRSPIKVKPSRPVCSSKADVVFVLDGSGSVGSGNFRLMKAFTKHLVGKFRVDGKHMRVGVVQYSSRSKVEFNLNKYSNMKDVYRAIDKIRYKKGWTRTDLALKDAYNMVKRYGRKNTPNVVLVVTDGNSSKSSRTRKMARYVHSKKLKVFSLGIGKGIGVKELRAIASKPSSQYMFRVKDFKSLKDIIKPLATSACKSIGISPIRVPGQNTPTFPKNVVRVGYSPVKRTSTDTAKVWTFIQRRSFNRPGRLYGVQFNANKAGRPLQVGVFRPTGRSGEFKTVYKYPISGRRIKVGTNTFNLYPRNIRVRKGDTIGFTWNKYGVVGYQPTKSRGTYYERNIVPSTGKKYKYSTKYGNRLYALRALYVPTKRVKPAKLTLTCDNRLAGVYVNGKKVRGLPNAGDWTKSKTVNVPRGTRTVAIECIDKGVIAGILASSNTGMVTDGTWKCSSTYRAKWYGVTYDDSKWHKATVIARNGAKPWGKRPGISSKAKWIWTSGFKGRHMRVFCRRSFGKRPAPQRTPIIPKNVVRVGYSPVKRSTTDGAKVWTFIQRRSFSRPGRLYGVQFNANKAGRPLQVGVFRPTGRSGEFKTVYKYPISGRRIKVGTNTFNLYPRNIRVRKGDTIGFTWNKYGVVGYQNTKSRGTYYERNIVPSTGKKYKYSTKYGNRLYALRALYVPSKRVKPAKLTLTCDNRLAGVYVNGKKVRGLPNAGDWTKSKTVNVPRGTRTVAIECIDKGVIAGILASSNTGMVTDGTWKCSSTYRAKWYGVTYDDSKWHKATVIARNGAKPWGKRPGISSKAKWIWTSGFKGRHMRVFCRRSFGKRPAPQRTPIIPKNVVRVGYSPVKRSTTDGAKVWTFIQRRSFSRPGRLYGVQFNANKAGRPLQVGVFRPTGRSGEFKTVYKYPISGRRIKVGTNTFNLYPRNIRVRKGDTIGFTWNKYGVVGYQPTKSRGTYYERNIVPSTGKKYKYSTKYGNRLYALRALYVPIKRVKPAKLTLTCDNRLAGVYVNGKKVRGLPNAGDWTKSKTVNVPRGTRTVAIECIDKGVIAGILASSNTGMVTDGTWKCSSTYRAKWYGVTYDDSKWHKATVIARNGAKPWGKRPGISSKAKWIWTSGFKGRHMRVFCRRSFGKRPAPQRTPIIPKNVVRVGYSPVKRSTTDGAKVWTFIQRRSFSRPGRLYGVQFNANKAGRPLQVGVFRPTGRSGEFKTVYKYPISGRRIKVGTNTFNLYPRNIRVRKGDTIGFTWNKYGVVGYQPTKSRGTYYERNIVPSTGKKYKYSTKYGNRLYALRALYVPFKRSPIKVKPSRPVCSSKADVVFVLDGSGSVGSGNFRLMKAFTKHLVGKFQVDGKHMRVGVVQYSSRSKVEFNLNKYSNMKDVYRAIDKIRYKKGWTRTDLALKDAYNMVKRYGRKNTPNVVLVVTDGNSSKSSRTRKMARYVHSKKLKVFSLGIGKGIGVKELRAIASKPSSQYMFRVKDFKSLKDIIKPLATAACKSIGISPIRVPGQNTPAFPKNVVRVGYSPVKRTSTDTAKVWTFIQRRSFNRPGRLYGVQFNANKAGRPLQVGVFRPTGRSGEFKTVYKYPISGRRIKVGTNTFNLYPRNIRVRKGDKIGFTWNKYGVVGYQPTKSRSTYYTRNIVPSTGKKYKYSTKHGNRLYAFRGLYVPSKQVKRVLPLGVVRVGNKPDKKGITDSAKAWTFIQRKAFSRPGRLFGVQFNANKVGRPLQIGVFRPGSKPGQFKTITKYSIPGNKIKKGVNLVMLARRKIKVKKGDKIGFTWTNYGVVGFTPTKYRGNYYERPVIPAVGKTYTYKTKYTNRNYAFRALYYPKGSALNPAGISHLGPKVVKRPSTDTAKLRTIVDKIPFPINARVYAIKFYSNVANRPLTVGLYRPTGKAGEFKTVGKITIPAEKIKKGLNMLSLAKRKAYVKKGDRIGYTWSKGGVIAYTPTKTSNKRSPYYEKDFEPKTKTVNKFGTRRTNKIYAIRALYVPDNIMKRTFPTDVKHIGPSVIKRPNTDKDQKWTFIDRKSFKRPSKVYGVKFFANKAGRPLTLGIYRPNGPKGSFKAMRQITIPGKKIEKGVNVVNLARKNVVVKKGDHLGFTLTDKGVVAFSNSKTPKYYDSAIAPKSGTTNKYYTKYAKRTYSIQALYKKITPPALPKDLTPVGQPAINRPKVDRYPKRTVIQRAPFRYPGRVYGVKFYARVPNRPLKVGIYRPIKGKPTSFKTIRTEVIPASKIEKGVNLLRLWNKGLTVKKGDRLGFTMPKKGVVAYSNSRARPKGLYYQNNMDPKTGRTYQYKITPNKIYSIRALYVPNKAPPVSLVVPKGSVAVGRTPMQMDKLDTVPSWTFIDRRTFPKPGRLQSVQFFAGKAGRPLTVGIYRPSTKPGEFKTVFQKTIPASKVYPGLNNVNLGKNRVDVKKGDSLGVTWKKGAVLSFGISRSVNNYYDRNVIPITGDTMQYGTKYSNRNYAIRAIFKPNRIPQDDTTKPDDTPKPKPDEEAEKSDDEYFDIKPRVLSKPRPRPLGVESGIIPDSYFRASTYRFGTEPYRARPSVTGGWKPAVTDKKPWIQVDLRNPMPVHGIGSLGTNGPNECYVKSYYVQVSTDGKKFDYLKQKNSNNPRLFVGNDDETSWKRHCLHRYYGEPVLARIVRFEPVESTCVGMRVELYGFRDANDPWLMKALRYDQWTKSRTGCTCYFDANRKDCACCQEGGCQCPNSNRHQCVQCGYGSSCGIPEVKPRMVQVDPWTRSEGGCTCQFDKTRKDCACCQRYGCQCGKTNPNQCVQCGHPEQCGTKENIFGPNKYCKPKTCSAGSLPLP